MIHVGLDIGGTKIMATAVDSEGARSPTLRAATPLDLAEGLALLHELTGRVAGGREIAAIGAAVGGPLDWQSGVVSPLHQPQWRAVPLKAQFEARWRCPFHVDVDTNVAAIGEFLASEPRVGSLLYVTVSTGVGGGLILGGKVFRGHDGAHPEFAHQAVPHRCSGRGKIECECGAEGCLEALVSGNGIRRAYGKPAEELDAAEWAEVADHLGGGLRNAAALYCPEEIVLGGGVAVGGGEKLLARIREGFVRNLRLVPTPRLRLSRHGYDTALEGALALARHAADFGYPA